MPNDGWLKVALGLKPEAWEKEGNGVYFFVGVSDGHAYEDLFTQTVNPFRNPSERRWIPVMVDLSAYAGQDMEIIFNTRASGPGQGADPRHDLPLWGAPEIVTRVVACACRCSIYRGSTRPSARDLLAAITRVCDSQRFIWRARGRGARA